MKDVKICLACSAGGHLTEILHLEPCYSKHKHFFLTFKRQDTTDLRKSEYVRFITDPGRNPVKLLKCVYETFVALSKERPEVVISTGAGVAIPACYMAKLLFGSKVVFLESFCRVEEPSLAGRLAYPIADLFLIQWPKLSKKYGPKAVYRGAIV